HAPAAGLAVSCRGIGWRGGRRLGHLRGGHGDPAKAGTWHSPDASCPGFVAGALTRSFPEDEASIPDYTAPSAPRCSSGATGKEARHGQVTVFADWSSHDAQTGGRTACRAARAFVQCIRP